MVSSLGIVQRSELGPVLDGWISYLIKAQFVWGAWGSDDEGLYVTNVAFFITDGESCTEVSM